MDNSIIIHFAAALFAIMNPLGNLPLFISATSGEKSRVRNLVALFLSLFVAVMLLVFFWTGTGILEFFGISLSSFRIAGGIILLLNGIHMVSGEAGKAVDNVADKMAAQSDVAEAEMQFKKILIPIGIPIFVGPGTISTVILFSGQVQSIGDKVGMSVTIVSMALLLFVLLLTSKAIGRVLGDMGLDIAARLMGLVLAAMGIQFILAGLAAVTNGLIDLSKLG